MDRPTAKRRLPSLATNTVAQSAPLITGYVGSFVSAPIVLASLGLRQFGIWALTGALASYAGLLDFGVGPALTRFVALYENDENPNLVGEFLGTGVLTSCLVGVALSIASLLCAGVLARHLGHVGTGSMLILLECSTGMLVASMLMNVLVAYRVGLREMIGPNVVLTLGPIINFGASVGAALASHRLVVYAEANAAASGLSLIITAVYSCVISTPRIAFHRPHRTTIKQLTSFSVKNQMQTAASLVNNQTDKIIIALFIGPAAAGAYELANRVAMAAKSIGTYTVSAMIPTLTAASREQDEGSVRRLYVRWTQRSTALSIPILFLVAALGPLVLGAWLGYVPRNSAFILAALSLGYVTITTTGVGFALAYAYGFPGLPAKSAIAMAIGNIILTVALAPEFGVWGVLSGTAVAFTAGGLYQVFLLHRKLDMPFVLYWDAIRSTLALVVVLSIPVGVAAVLLASSDRDVKIIATLTAGAYFFVAYTILASRMGTLPEAVSRRLRLNARNRRVSAA